MILKAIYEIIIIFNISVLTSWEGTINLQTPKFF